MAFIAGKVVVLTSLVTTGTVSVTVTVSQSQLSLSQTHYCGFHWIVTGISLIPLIN
jgi:hypothetical protein